MIPGDPFPGLSDRPHRATERWLHQPGADLYPENLNPAFWVTNRPVDAEDRPGGTGQPENSEPQVS